MNLATVCVCTVADLKAGNGTSLAKERMQALAGSERAAQAAMDVAGGMPGDLSFPPSSYSSTLHALLKPSLLASKMSQNWPSAAMAAGYQPLATSGDMKHLTLGGGGATPYDDHGSRVGLTSSLYNLTAAAPMDGGVTYLEGYHVTGGEPYVIGNYAALSSYDAYGYGVCHAKGDPCYGDNCRCADEKAEYEDYHKTS